jgi:hypothetical protein
MDQRQVILLAIAIGVPVALFALHRPRWVAGWVALTLSIHIFDTTTLTNLPAGRIVGLLYLPYTLLSLRSWLRLGAAQAWLVSFVYMVLLGLLFGFILPWPDTTGNRPLTMQAPGRAIVYLTRLVADLSLTVFIAQELRKPGALLFLGKTFVVGATISAFVGVLNLVLPGFDVYYYITGLRFLNGVQFQRSRGLSFEPRGLGMMCVYALMIIIIFPGRMSKHRIVALIITSLGILVSYSTSSFALLSAGIATIWLLYTNRARIKIINIIIMLCLLVAIGAIVTPTHFAVAIETVTDHIDPSNRLRGAQAENLVQEIAYRLDSFDGSALLFLADNPEFILLGTGPGMILLPASNYIPPGLFTLMYGEIGLNGLPTHGPLLELSNGGILGVALWVFQIIACLHAINVLRRRIPDNQRQEWRFGRMLFIIGVVFYTVQTSITSPIWGVVLAIGWAAAMENIAYARTAKTQSLVPFGTNPHSYLTAR